MKSKFKKLMAAALVLCLMLALLPAGVLADGVEFTYFDIKQYKEVQANGFKGGTVIVSDLLADGNYTLTVKADENYGIKHAQLKYEKDDGTVTDIIPIDNVAELTYDIDPEKTTTTTIQVQVGFKELYTVNTSGITGGTVTATPTTAFEGDPITLEVAADENYEYVAGSLKVTDSAGANVEVTGNTFTMPNDNVTVSATFKETTPVDPEPPAEPTYTVSASGNDGGSVWVNKSTGLKAGDTVTVTVEPLDGYWLESLTVGGKDVTDKVDWDWYWYYGRTGTYSFTVTGNTNVVATFSTWYYDDVACFYDGRHGNVTVKVWDDAGRKFVTTSTAEEGDLVALIVEPYNGYMLGSLSISERDRWGSSVEYWQSWREENVYYFYMPDSPVNVYADFTEAYSEHMVYVDSAKNGTLKADETWAYYGEVVYVTAKPDAGFKLDSLKVRTAKGDYLKVYEANKADTWYFYMPDQYVTISAQFKYAGPSLPFDDVASGDWYYDAVKFVYEQGIMQGVSSTKFSPNGTVTRGMLVTMLWRMAGEPYVGGGSFDDVASGSYYATAVAWAAKNGIVDGYNSTRFGPNDAVTREQIATMLYRYAKWLGYSTSGSSLAGYSDASSVSSWAKDAMGWAVKNSVVTGVTATKLNPASSATRAETAQMFMNFYEYLN